MKKFMLFSFALLLSFGFVFTGISENKDKKASVTNCPYVNSVLGSSSSSECPYLSGQSKKDAACPYLEKSESSKCPYTEKMKEGNIKNEKRKNTPSDIKSS